MGVLVSTVGSRGGGHPFKQPGLPQLEQALQLGGEAAPEFSNPGAPEGLVPKTQGQQGPDPSWSPSLYLGLLACVRVPGCLLRAEL